MKVLMLGWELPPHNSGGLGVACAELCRALSQQQLDITFILPYDIDQSDHPYMILKTATPYDVTSVTKAGSAYSSYLYRYTNGKTTSVDLFQLEKDYEQAIEKIVETEQFDIIHAHDWITFRAGLRAKALSNKPLVVHVHATEFDRSGGEEGNSLIHDIEYQAMMMADQVIAVSQLTKNTLVHRYHIPPDKIQVVHNSINIVPSDLDPKNAYRYVERMKSHGYKTVAFVGRLTLQKGLIQFMQTAAKVLSKHPKTLFIVVGAGDQYEELLRLTAQFGISSKVIFTGFQRGKQWRDAFEIADLFVMPSISEPFGLVALEALNFGTPVLISKQSGVSELLQSALKADYWDVDKMADQIVGVLKSESLGPSLLANGMREITGMSWHKTAEQMRSIYAKHMPSGVSA